ncbi:peroxisomal targeting signal 2 receptor [Ramicandelaber brevisporus]|nr:peroxisomal targeting signal 2 receptor [Ramicandelaber brevisporus]
MSRVAQFRTEGFKGFSVKFSPFFEDRVACAAAANFGLAGSGRLYVLGFGPSQPNTPAGQCSLLCAYDNGDAFFDCSWSELHQNHIVTASGDGGVRLFDVSVPNQPIAQWREHQREVQSVEWNYVSKGTFLSSSMDGTVKLWAPQSQRSLRTFSGHARCVYQASWNPFVDSVFATASGDNLVKVWDVRQQQPGTECTVTFQPHAGEVLSVDWNKYREHILVTSSVDSTARIWDLRMTNRELVLLAGHKMAVRRVKYSPHNPDILGTASYDMSTRFWDTQGTAAVYVQNAHTEFAFGLDYSLFRPGLAATCGWDEVVDLPTTTSARRSSGSGSTSWSG